MVCMLFAVGARGAQLCLDPSDRTVASSAVQRWGKVTLRAPRGDVLDRHGRRLATTVDTPSVVVDPMLVRPEEVPELSRKVASILDLDSREVGKRMRRDTRYARLASHVHPALVDRIERLDHRALWVHRNPRRYYPEGNLASQVVGFVDAAGNGRQGLESSLDEYLRGGVTLEQRRRDRRGYGVDGPAEDPLRARGMDVHTTLDRVVQRIAERALEGVVERHAPRAAYATVVEVKTGDILAMANAPSYNPNLLATDAFPRRNHPVQDAFEPGSVLKPFTLAAAVEEGLVSERTIVDCEGGTWYVGRTRIRDDHPRRLITTTEVMKYSSNIGAAKLALHMGPESFIEHLRDFGFADRTGVALPGERRGQIRHPDRIKSIELATTAYGQGMTVTQLQLAMATAAIANGGVLLRPRLVTKVVDTDGTPAWQQRPQPVRRVLSREVAEEVARMMVTVTEPGGTATRARVEGYEVAGKTGTAEKVKDGQYTDARVGSFIGFVPAGDPLLAIVVTVDEPSRGSRYGGVVAAPAFAEIAGQSLRYLGVPPDHPEVDRGEVVAGVAPNKRDPVRLAWAQDGWTLPDFVGRPMREVLVGLEDAGLKVRIEGSGRAVAQRPAPGERVTFGDTVSVVFR
jgi:cell division protein FtsI (penicillin-binding protein 3)